MKEKEIYCGTLEECLIKWSKGIEELEAKAKEAEGGKEAEYRVKIDELHRIGKEMKAKLDEIRKAGDHEWESRKRSAERIREELMETMGHHLSRFK